MRRFDIAAHDYDRKNPHGSEKFPAFGK